jgi:hypothetical protein
VQRKAYWPILLIGVLLVVMPFAISLPSKASSGQKMLDAFHPIMQPAAVQHTAYLYHNIFLPLGPVAAGGVAAAGETSQMFAGLAAGMHMTQPQLLAYMTKSYPAMTQLLSTFPQIVPIFQQVGPGLAAFAPLVATMQANVKNYAAIDSLPNFNLFTWFFVVPGLLIVLFAVWGLMASRRRVVPQAPRTDTSERERDLVGVAS